MASVWLNHEPLSASHCSYPSFLQAALLTLQSVKDIHPERRLTRSMLWEDPKSGGDVGTEDALLQCSLLQKGGSIDGPVAKRPGRCDFRTHKAPCTRNEMACVPPYTPVSSRSSCRWAAESRKCHQSRFCTHQLSCPQKMGPGGCLAALAPCGSVLKPLRPCRLCTRSTIGLHEEEEDFRDPFNGTGMQRRHLLSKNSVTAAFSAQSLWAAGFQGKGVKMGVFDTGIRDDHPHVKNIK